LESEVVTDAITIASDLEQRRHRLMIKHVVLSNQTLALAYDVVVNGSFVAREKLRSLDHELERIADEISLIDRAFVESVKRTTARDAGQVMQELGFGANK
jgi:hypothetical protein